MSGEMARRLTKERKVLQRKIEEMTGTVKRSSHLDEVSPLDKSEIQFTIQDDEPQVEHKIG